METTIEERREKRGTAKERRVQREREAWEAEFKRLGSYVLSPLAPFVEALRERAEQVDRQAQAAGTEEARRLAESYRSSIERYVAQVNLLTEHLSESLARWEARFGQGGPCRPPAEPEPRRLLGEE